MRTAPPAGFAARPGPPRGHPGPRGGAARGTVLSPSSASGLSAGGLEAFTQLLTHLPDTTGMAFVLVQHLDPRHPSQLTELLARATRMPVVEVTDGTAVRPDHVYVIPPNTNLAFARGVLHLTHRGETHGQHLPVDHLLRSLAEDRKNGRSG